MDCNFHCDDVWCKTHTHTHSRHKASAPACSVSVNNYEFHKPTAAHVNLPTTRTPHKRNQGTGNKSINNSNLQITMNSCPHPPTGCQIWGKREEAFPNGIKIKEYKGDQQTKRNGHSWNKWIQYFKIKFRMCKCMVRRNWDGMRHVRNFTCIH